MAIEVRYQPPVLNPVVALAAAKEAAEIAGAFALLRATLPKVPLDTGALYASGTVEHFNGSAAVLFSAINEEDNYDYAAHVHEDLEAHHPHGESKFLEKTMHSDGLAVLAAVAGVERKALEA